MNNIPNDIRVPLFYAEMDNSQANSGATQLRRLLIGLVNDDVTPEAALRLLSSPAEVASVAGPGSMLHEMYVIARQNDPIGETWVLPVKISAGAKSTGKVTISGAAAAGGTLSVYVADARVQVKVALLMTAEEIASAVEGAINAATLPVTAVAAAKEVTVTCKFSGEIGNDIRLSINLLGSAGGEVLPQGVLAAVTPMAGGTGVPDLDAALAAVGDEPFEFITHAFTDIASLNTFRDLMNDLSGRWAWNKQLYGHVYGAKRGTMGELVTFGRTRNDPHGTVRCVEPQKPTAVWKCAAGFAARTAVFISADPARPTQTGAIVGEVPAPVGQRFGLTEHNSLLWAGIATTYFEGDYERISRAVTLYQTNAYGQPDDSYLDSETLHQSAYILRKLRTDITSKYGRHKLANDGTRFGAGQAIITPNVIKAELIAGYGAMERDGIVENAKAFRAHLIVERDANNPNRVNVLYPPDYVNQLRIFALRNEFRLQYMQEIA
jgi:phage tail sheath gpL-like